MKRHYILLVGLAIIFSSCSKKKKKGDHQTAIVTLYEHASFNGIKKELNESIGYLGPDWNDRVSSLKISEGYEANFYEHANFQGSKITLKGPINFNCSLENNDYFSSVEIIQR